MPLNNAAKIAKEWMQRHGRRTPRSLGGPNNRTYMLATLMEAGIRLGKVAEATRNNDPETFAKEMTLALIWMLDVCGTMGIDVQQIFDEITKGDAGGKLILERSVLFENFLRLASQDA